MLRLGRHAFADDRPLVMAIVNRTPDSFYDQGRTYDAAAALDAVDRAVEDGADIIDVGGVKAGTGDHVSVDEEIRRVVPFVAAVREGHPDVVISVDTWRSPVGRLACEAGADLLNDAWGGHDPELAAVAAEHDVGLVCSHAGGLPPRTDPVRPAYDDVMADVVSTVLGLAERAVRLGVRRDGILLDPAHDFGKDTRQSLEVTRRLAELTSCGWPVLVALSRKDFLGEALDLPAAERLEASLAAAAVCAWLGARVFRVHDVRATRRVVDTVATIAGTRPPSVLRRGLVRPSE